MNKIANKQAICDVLLEQAEKEKDIVVLCSDSRGSSSMAPFAEQYPFQFVEVGIAEQNLVSIAAGLTSCGKRAVAVSPACFLSTRSMEQIKVDVAYNNFGVICLGISGGVSYGSLGMTHHSLQDIAALSAIPGMRVYLPSDRHQSRVLVKQLLADGKPAYIRVGRNPVKDVYTQDNVPFSMDEATLVREGKDVTIIACGEMVAPAAEAAELLGEKGVEARVLDMYCVKPLDQKAVLKAAMETKAILTVEEHCPTGGLGSMVSQVVTESCPVKVRNLTLPDEPVVTGDSAQVFAYYGLTPQGIAEAAVELIRNE